MKSWITDRSARTGWSCSAVVPSSFATDATDAAPVISLLWQELCARLGTNFDSSDYEFVGVSTPADDLVPPHRITYVATALPTGDATDPGGLADFELEGGSYVVFPYRGPVSGLDDFYTAAYMREVPALGLSTRAGQHLEMYLAAVTESQIAIEAWIPINSPAS